jgi:hypothetical protein
MVTASGATIYICPEGFEFFGQGERDCENVIGNNIEYISKLLDGYLPTEKAIKYERYEALPANRREFMDMFVILSQAICFARLFFTPHEGCHFILRHSRQKPVPDYGRTYRESSISSIQYTEYIKARVRERSLEDKAAKEGPESTTKVYIRLIPPILNIVFPVEDGSKWRRDEVRADMQDVEDYSEGVVNKNSKTLSIPNV